MFKPNDLVRIISLPWKTYCEDLASIGSVVTIDYVRPLDWYNSNNRFAVIKEFLDAYPQHNIGTRHLQSLGLRLSISRNKREGHLDGYVKGKYKRGLRDGKPVMLWSR